LFFHLFSYWFLFSIACIWIFIYLFLYLYSFFLNSCAECVLLYFLHFLHFFYIPTIYECIFLSSLFLILSLFFIFGPLFCIVSWFKQLFINLVVIGFLISLLFHLFDVRSLHKSCLQTAPDFTDRIFRWTIHHSEPL